MPWHRQILSRCLVFKKFVIASFCGEGVALGHERNPQRNLFRKLFKQIKLCMEVINYDDSWKEITLVSLYGFLCFDTRPLRCNEARMLQYIITSQLRKIFVVFFPIKFFFS